MKEDYSEKRKLYTGISETILNRVFDVDINRFSFIDGF